jgi:ComF family protein
MLDFCYPHRCARCEALTSGPFLCVTCDSELRDLERRPACERCAMPLGGPGGACPYCEGEGVKPFDRIVALGLYRDPLRHLIYNVKYHGRWPLAERLADRLLEQEAVKGLLSDVDCLVPVPLHRSRQVSRGFNQSDVVARRLKKHTGKPVKHPSVRLKKTDPQIQFHSRAKREENLKDAFGLVHDRPIRDKHVLIVDDIMTTGATLQSFARTLRHAAPASLSVLVLAVADPLGQDFQVI